MRYKLFLAVASIAVFSIVFVFVGIIYVNNINNSTVSWFVNRPDEKNQTRVAGSNGIFYITQAQVNGTDMSLISIKTLSSDRLIWSVEVPGLSYAKFIDINEDGMPEVQVDNDGGGNRPTCNQSFYKWDGNTFKNLKFIYKDKEIGERNDIWCAYGGKLNPGRNPTYTAYIWKHMYPKVYEEQIGLGKPVDEWDIKARLCKKIEQTFKFNIASSSFVEYENRTVEENHDTYQDGVFYDCY